MDNIVIILFVVLISKTASQDCAEWTSYEGNCYTVERDQKSWHDAESWCMQNGGHLASIETEAERNFILGISKNENIWIGLNQLSDRNGNYMWSDGSSSEFRDWAEGQPVEGGLQQCIYTEVPYTHPGDCFDQKDGRSAIKGVLDKPQDASPPDTFYLGNWDEDEQGIQMCMEACRDYGDSAECHSYTFVSTFYTGDPDWTGECVGASSDFTVDVVDLFSYKGTRMPCQVNYHSSKLWYSSNCGAPLGFVCKKPIDSGGPVTIPPPQDVDSYCPDGYFNIAGGNKCFKVVTTTTENSGKTWDEALQECRAGPGINPDLASITSVIENAEVLAAFKDYSYGAWLGYFVDVRSGLFLWADNSNPVYDNWDEGQPNSPETKTCTEMWIHPGKPGTWSSLDCGTRRGYVCQTFKDPDNPIDNTPAPPVSCRAGWTSFWYACYKIHTEAKTWQDAQDSCVNEQSHLVSIHSEMENSAVFAFTQHMGHIWTGLREVDDKYEWTDGWVTRYTNWGDGGTEGGEGCVEMLEEGEWKDEACTKTHPFLCKYSDNPKLTTPVLTEGYCPEGWPEWGDHCYFFNSETTPKNWDDADLSCVEFAGEGFTGHLASIHSFVENEYIMTELKDRHQPTSAWIGFRRNSKESWFEWSDGSPTDYEFWSPDSPDGEAYDIICGEMYIEQWQGAWNDEQCPSQRETYVCKTPKAPVTTPTPSTPTTTPTLPPLGDHDCPGGSEKYGDICYMFHPNEVLSFEEAIESCVTNSGGKATLASIHDETENWFIYNRMKELAVNHGNQRYWIGLYKEGLGDCFSSDTGRNRISGIIDKPSDASPPDTFHFGEWTKNQDDDEAIEWCMDECRKVSECYAFNFDSVMSGSPENVWKGHCVGRSIDYSTNVPSFWSYSGERYHCAGKSSFNADGYQWVNGKEVDYENWSPDRDLAGGCAEMIPETGQWDDVSCSTEQGYVCRWEEDAAYTTVPIPSTTTTSSTGPRSTVITTTPSTTTTSRAAAPGLCLNESWILWNDNCYLFGVGPTQHSSWVDSQTECQSLDGDLVSIHSLLENDFIVNELRALGEPGGWTGLFQNITDPGPFEYVSDYSALYGIINPDYDYPSDADGIDTFNFGQNSGWIYQDCEELCKDNLRCAAATFWSYHPYYYWDHVCMGRSDRWDALEYDSYADSGVRLLHSGSNETFEWIDGSQVNVTFWGPGEPQFTNHTHGCTAVRDSTGAWHTTSCSDQMAYVCEATPAPPPTGDPEPDRTQPQYQIRLFANFSSQDGADFSQQCVVQYASMLNQKALQVSVLVNSQIGSQICTGVQPEDVRIVSASCPMNINENEGGTNPTFYLSLGANLVIGEVESCAQQVTELLLPHSNWGEPLIPNIPGCSGVTFDDRDFTHEQDQWMCVDSFSASIGEESVVTLSVPLHYGFTHSGSLASEFGEDISMDCTNRYNTDFNIKTFEMVQTTNQQISSGQLCQGFDVSIATASAFLLVDGSQGLTSQSYAVQLTHDMLFSEVYQCSEEISGFLTNHENWITPILPQLPGCPTLVFDPELFREMSQRWICLAAL